MKPWLFFVPIFLFLEITAITTILSLFSQPNDTAILIAMGLSCIFLASNYYLFTYLKSKTR